MSDPRPTEPAAPAAPPPRRSLVDHVIRFSLERKLIVFLAAIVLVVWGVLVAPFDWSIKGLPRDPVPVDAIPDIGENQQIVFTRWSGRSPQDIEDQVTYPLTTALLGIPGVKTVRSRSMFGFSTIYIIFKEKVEFYWSRSRVLEKLSSLPPGTLPQGVQPMLGPDATALGQIFWYTLEGRDNKGNPTGGWDLQELRTIQDWYVRYALGAAEGVAEVASIGGYVKEYQVDVDPDAMRAHGVALLHIIAAIKKANRDVGARTVEINKVEYVVRGIGFIKSLADIEDSVIHTRHNVPIYVKDVAKVSLGPALRRGALDKEGAEAVGGVVVARYGANPLAVIKNVKKKIKEITPGLPKKTLADGTESQVRIVPFYDRSGLINETLATLNTALTDEILITIIVVLIMLMHLKSSALISGLLPVAVLLTFIAMKVFGVDANVVALSGIAIAIGTMVDMGIVITENIVRHLERAGPEEDGLEIVYRASSEVGGAVLTAVATTVVSFLPVFAMEAAEGKLFKPLAFTKTFALIASILVSLTLIPALAHLLFAYRVRIQALRIALHAFIVLIGIAVGVIFVWWLGLAIALIGIWHLVRGFVPEVALPWIARGVNAALVLIVGIVLAGHWLPLGPEKGLLRNFVLAAGVIGGLLIAFRGFLAVYPRVLGWALRHKLVAMAPVVVILALGIVIWQGLQKEFMPPLDEGSYLFMPTTMPHASIGEAMDSMRKQDMAIRAIPEVEMVVGKLGRADSPLDPAPVSMFETVINYKTKYLQDKKQRRPTFRYDPDAIDLFRTEKGQPAPAPDGKPYRVRGRFARDKQGRLIPDPDGMPFRQWRPPLHPKLNKGRAAWKGIHKPDDIWREITRVSRVPGVTPAPRLQPIAARIVMLQSGMRAPMGVKIKAPDLETLERVAIQIEKLLRNVPGIIANTVVADRVVGKPYLEIHINRRAIARYGIKLDDAQRVVEFAIGGQQITTTVEGRQRYGVRVRYLRELRDNVEALKGILVPAPGGAQVPLRQIAEIKYMRGPQVIKSEDTFLVAYVTFDKKPEVAEVTAVERAGAYLKKKIKSGELKIPKGVSYTFAGTYENQVRSEKRLLVILPLALVVIFILLYLQFRSVITTFLVFSGIAVAWAGGFILIWLYGEPWFLDLSIFGANLREMFQAHPLKLSVAIWVGFLALFGIATDNGVVQATYLDQRFAESPPRSIDEIREAALEAGNRRARACLMTTATTLLALLPVLTSSGRGSDIMVPMAIPSFGGMLIGLLSMLVVPVLYSAVKEAQFHLKIGAFSSPAPPPPAAPPNASTDRSAAATP